MRFALAVLAVSVLVGAGLAWKIRADGHAVNARMTARATEFRKALGDRPGHVDSPTPITFGQAMLAASKISDAQTRSAKMLQATYARAVVPLEPIGQLPKISSTTDALAALLEAARARSDEDAALAVCVDGIALGRDLLRAGGLVEAIYGATLISRTIDTCESVWIVSANIPKAAKRLTQIRAALPKISDILRREHVLRFELEPKGETLLNELMLSDLSRRNRQYEDVLEGVADDKDPERARAVAQAIERMGSSWNTLANIARPDDLKYVRVIEESEAKLDALIARLGK